MPHCHFELEHSDYLTSRKRGSGGAGGGNGRGRGGEEGDGYIDSSSTRVIEFHSCGVGTKIVK